MTLGSPLSSSSSDSLPDDPSERAFTQMAKRLQRVRQPAQMFAALRWGLEELDRVYAATAPSVLHTVACRAGCDACCHGPVDVQAHEVFYAADHIQRHFAPQALDDLISRLERHRERIAALAAGERDRVRQPCALLSAGACSIYAARPQPCRAHHTNNATTCHAHRDDPSVDIAAAYIPALRARMFAVMLSVDAAVEFAGYDDRAYDFGCALHEALTNRLCLEAWMRQEPAFSDACLADRDDASGSS